MLEEFLVLELDHWTCYRWSCLMLWVGFKFKKEEIKKKKQSDSFIIENKKTKTENRKENRK